MARTARGEDGKLNLDGVSLEYLSIVGRDPSHTLILLHEGLGCTALWRDFPAALARATGHSVFAYSRAGYGGSSAVALPRPLDYMTREAVDVLPRLIEFLSYDSYSLIGHSDGASIALVYAGRETGPSLHRVVLMAPHVFAETMGIASIERVKSQFEQGNLRPRLGKYHGSNVDCAFYGWCDSWLHPDFLAWSIEAELASIRVPILQIQGSDDEYGSRAQLDAIENAVSAPVTTNLIAQCGHAPHLEQPQQTIDTIASFLRRY